MARTFTGIEEAYMVIAENLTRAKYTQSKLAWYSIFSMIYMHGVINTLVQLESYVHELLHKHDNSGGGLN